MFVELAPDVTVEVTRILRWNRHARATLTRSYGTHHGGPFENLALVVALARGSVIQRCELFDAADVERALARFDELCASVDA